MGKRTPYTPRSKIRSALRMLFLRSRERAATLKRDKNTCQCGCGRKASKAKGKEFYVEVHHINSIENWDKVIDEIYKYILCDPVNLVTLGKECHKKSHAMKKINNI